MTTKFTLKKTERLKSRKGIEALFTAGRSFFLHPFKVYYAIGENKPNVSAYLQAGVAVSSRHFKKAVDRNRIKRITREAYRIQKNELQQKMETTDRLMTIFFVYAGKEIPAYGHLREKLNLILERLIQKADEKNNADT